jgi:hypothetical protein
METKVELGIRERLTICRILPKEGNFVTLKLIRDLLNKVGLKAEEYTEFGIKEEGGMVMWNENANVPKPFEFAEAERELIKRQLKQLDESNKLDNETIAIYEKFM